MRPRDVARSRRRDNRAGVAIGSTCARNCADRLRCALRCSSFRALAPPLRPHFSLLVVGPGQLAAATPCDAAAIEVDLALERLVGAVLGPGLGQGFQFGVGWVAADGSEVGLDGTHLGEVQRQLAVTAKGGALKEHEARVAREKERGSKNLEAAQTGAGKGSPA